METMNEFEVRKNKVKELKKAGFFVYGQNFKGKQDIKNIKLEGEKGNLKDGNEILQNGADNKFVVAGRLIMFRTHGKLSFGHLIDSTGKIQIALVKGKTKLNFNGKEILEEINIADQTLNSYKFFEKYIDIGDFIGVKGDLFITKHGELTLFVNEFQLLAKALRPLPEKFHGIQDQEKIYRHRYLDLIMNEESYKRFLLRSKFLKVIRDFYHQNGFVEVETSILGNYASGAAAKPFVTHHNDFDIDMYLRISPETALKKLTVGRFEKVFEVAKDFRNEGSDPSHHQEFTMIEHYAVWRDFKDNMDFTERMFDYIFQNIPELSKKVKVKSKEGKVVEVDFSTPRKRLDYVELIKKDCGIDVSQYKEEDEEKLRNEIKSKGISREGIDQQSVPTMIDYLFKKVSRPKIVGPAFVYNYPKTMQPLARVDDENPKIVQQWQLIVNGREIIKAYSELVDPILQKENFQQQKTALQKGDEEAVRGDDDFVLAMEYGMPPQSGWGMGIDRILALLTEQENIRDVILFPLMKPEGGEE